VAMPNKLYKFQIGIKDFQGFFHTFLNIHREGITSTDNINIRIRQYAAKSDIGGRLHWHDGIIFTL
jgi:hypothetical protein